MALSFDMSKATRIAVQRAGKVAKLAFIKNDEAFKSLNVGEALDITEELATYSEDCRSIINKMVALNGDVPSKDRTKITAALSAFRREMKDLHGDKFDYVGGYFNNNGDAIYAIERTA
jgi:hypothetical protein